MILEEHFQEIMDYFQRKLVVHVRGMGKATAINENTFIPRLESTYFEAATQVKARYLILKPGQPGFFTPVKKGSPSKRGA